MEKEKKEKMMMKKKKKSTKREESFESEMTSEPNIPFEREYENVDKTSTDEDKANSCAKRKNRNVAEGFCIAHPRSVKKTTETFQDIHSRKLAELLEAFHIFDFDRDGEINREDLKKTFASLNRDDVKDEEIDHMLGEALNPLNFDAFVVLLGYKTLDLDPEEVFLDALSNWDDHREGLISHERLMHDIMALGDKFTEEEAIAALADAPIVLTKTKEKMIDYVQFSEDLCGLRKMMQRKQPNEA